MKKVFIIGAGPAGLTAAYKLAKANKDYKIIILEEAKEIGGISRTVKYNKNRMDIGGHRFFSKDQEVMNFWKELMPIQGKPTYDDKKLNRKSKLEENGPDPEKEDEAMLVRNRVSRIYYNGNFYDYPISVKLETFKNMGLITSIIAGFSYLKSMIFKRKEDSLENFYINRFGKKLYSMFFEGYTEKLWGRHPREIDASWGAQRVKGLSIISIIKDIFSKMFKTKNHKVETSLIEEFYYPKYGPGQLWEKLASECQKLNVEIIHEAKVTNVLTNKNKIAKIQYEYKNKIETKESDIIISSMPLNELILGIDNCPKEIKEVAKGLPYRDFVTVGFLINKINLKNKTNIKTLGNIVPDCWIYIQDSTVKLGRLQIFNNWSPYLVKNPEETVWMGTEYFCNENDEFWNMSEKETIKFVQKELIKIGIIDENEKILDAHKECVKKAYPAYFDSYNQIDKIKEYVNSIDNLYCIGRNGQHRYNNMDHSMVTAFETVKNILNNNSNKNNIWNVNTEKEYHEESSEK